MLAGNRLNSLLRRNFFRNKFSIPFTSVKQAQEAKFERNLGVMLVVLCVHKNFFIQRCIPFDSLRYLMEPCHTKGIFRCANPLSD